MKALHRQPRPVPLPSHRDRPLFGMLSFIQDTVALTYDLNPSHMRSQARDRSAAWPRQVAMYLARELTGKSFPCIGREFGNRDHSTVIHAIKAVERRMASDDLYRADVEALREALS